MFYDIRTPCLEISRVPLPYPSSQNDQYTSFAAWPAGSPALLLGPVCRLFYPIDLHQLGQCTVGIEHK